MARARQRILEWLGYRWKYGFSEWHSNVYDPVDVEAPVGLVEFATDIEIANKATSAASSAPPAGPAMNPIAGFLASTFQGGGSLHACRRRAYDRAYPFGDVWLKSDPSECRSSLLFRLDGPFLL